MKKLMSVILFAAFALPVAGRLMKDWTLQDMFADSDLVVIATPVGTSATEEHTTLEDLSPPVSVIGVNTEFRVRLVFKGDQGMDKLVLHHYKLGHEQTFINGPQLVTFDSKPWPKPVLLFLVRERDGRYAPVTGQTDPALYSVIQLQTDAK